MLVLTGVFKEEYSINVGKQYNEKQRFPHCRNNSKIDSGAGTAYPSGAPEFTPGFWWGSCYSIDRFICMFCGSLFVLLYFFLLRYTDSDCPFGILNSS